MQVSPWGQHSLTRTALAAWLVTASVGALLPAFAAVAGEISETAKLLASDGTASDFFGTSVAVAGDTAVVGARQHDDHGNDSGSAYVFRYNGAAWVERAKLTASDAAAGDFFGHSVALAGDTAVVGAQAHDDNGSNSGSAYIFSIPEPSAWALQASALAVLAGLARHGRPASRGTRAVDRAACSSRV